MKKLKIALLTMTFIMACTVTAFATDDVFVAGEAFLGDTKDFIIKISSIVAVIGIGFGAFICKTAAGNPQKIEKGFTAIKWSIFGWVLVNGSMMIFATLDKYMS